MMDKGRFFTSLRFVLNEKDCGTAFKNPVNWPQLTKTKKLMPKINPKNIYFFEVEDEDRGLVTAKCPNARIFKEPFSEKNAKACASAEILCGFVHSVFSEESIKKCPNLKLIVTRSVGYDKIDLKYANSLGIAVCNVPDYGSHVIAEHVFALLLASIRNVLEGEDRTAHDLFTWKGLRGIALKGKTLGVVGTGKIGMNVCRIASLGFLMDVIAYDKFPIPSMAREHHFTYVKSLDELLKRADVITLHMPLFEETRHLINKTTIGKMKDGCVLINTARGGLIDTPALVKAIKAKKFSHVALDVIEHEENLKEDKKLLHLPGVIITPHIAFYADDSMKRMYEESLVSIDAFLQDKELRYRVHGH